MYGRRWVYVGVDYITLYYRRLSHKIPHMAREASPMTSNAFDHPPVTVDRS